MTESIHVRGEGGVIWEMDLPLPEGVAQRLAKDDLVRVHADGSRYEEPEPEGPGAPSDPDPFATKRPADSASKKDWVVYAVSKGATVNDAEGLTKAELIELYGQE